MSHELISSQLSRAVGAYKDYMSGLGVGDELDTHHALAVDIAIEEGRVDQTEGKLLFSTRLLATLAHLKRQQALELDQKSAHLCAQALRDALLAAPCEPDFEQLHRKFVQEYFMQASGVCEDIALQEFASTRLLATFCAVDGSLVPCREEYVRSRLADYRARMARQFEEEKKKLLAATEREANCFGQIVFYFHTVVILSPPPLVTGRFITMNQTRRRMGQGELLQVKNELHALQSELDSLECEQTQQVAKVEKETNKCVCIVQQQHAAEKENAALEADCKSHQEHLDAATHALCEGEKAWDIEQRSLEVRIKAKQSNVSRERSGVCAKTCI
jgi:hypothetical protein